MTEDFETCDFEYSNENDLLEEEVDKLNDLTFGDEIACQYDNINFEKDDSNFVRFPFDEFESNDDDINFLTKDKNDNDTDNLLGLKGSFFNFGLFKSAQKGDEELTLNNNRDIEFEIAMGKLDLLDVEDDKSESVKTTSTTGLGFGDFNIAPITELTRYSEILCLQFQECQRTSMDTQYLSSIVAKHLNLLSKKLSELSLPIEVLAQLRYFRMLTTFVNADSRINEVRTRCGNDPRLYNAEIAVVVQQFLSQSPQQQADLAVVHPFYHSLMGYLCTTRPVAPIVRSSQSWQSPAVVEFNPDNGGWMSESERDWLMKTQTRNLVTDNPYVHDYYYTAVTFKAMSKARTEQLAATGTSTIADPISLLPSPITADQLGAGIDPGHDGLTPQYTPIQFANSLGTLTSSNLNTPRKTLDVPQRRPRALSPPSAWMDSYEEVRSHRELLGRIEAVLGAVLRVDEVDKSLAKVLVALHRSRPVLLRHRGQLVHALTATIAERDTFTQFWSVAKGAAAIVSVLAIVDDGQFAELLMVLVRDSAVVWRSPFLDDCQHRLSSVVVARIKQATKEALAAVIGALFRNRDSSKPQGPSLADFCRSQFGLLIVFTVLDAFLKQSPEDKFNITQLVHVTQKCCDLNIVPAHIRQQCPLLFPL